MQEIVKCPSCSARYCLRPERVHSGLMRARCFRCGTDFPVAEAVLRLLNEAPCKIDNQKEDSSVACNSVKNTIAAEHDGLQSFVEFPTTDKPEPASTSGDHDSQQPLEMSEPIAEADTTTPPESPSAAAEIADEPIETPKAVQPEPASASNDHDSQQPQKVSEPIAEADTTTPPESPSAAAEIANEPIETPKAVQPAPAPPPPQETPKPSTRVEPIIPFEPPKQEVAEFKIRTSETLIEHLKIEEVAAMAEDGILKEYHLVARQSSENWIEAPKVPALRPIYDKRRSLLNPDEPPSLSVLDIPHKRGLFSRLFGRK